MPDELDNDQEDFDGDGVPNFEVDDDDNDGIDDDEDEDDDNDGIVDSVDQDDDIDGRDDKSTFEDTALPPVKVLEREWRLSERDLFA